MSTLQSINNNVYRARALSKDFFVLWAELSVVMSRSKMIMLVGFYRGRSKVLLRIYCRVEQ